MSSTIIDETVILRYLLNDDEVLSPRAAKVIATRTTRVYPEIITRVAVTLRDVYKVPRPEIAAAMTKLLDDVMVDEPTVIAFAIKLFGRTHMDFSDCLLAARTAIYNDDVVSFGKPIIQGMIDYRRKRQTAAEARSRSTDATIDKLRHRPNCLFSRSPCAQRMARLPTECLRLTGTPIAGPRNAKPGLNISPQKATIRSWVPRK